MLVTLLALHYLGQRLGKLFDWWGHYGLENLIEAMEQVDREERILLGICRKHVLQCQLRMSQK